MMITCWMGVAVLFELLGPSSALILPTAGPKRLNCRIAISARIERAVLAATLLNSMFSSSLSEIFERTEQGRPYATKITCAFVEHEFRETPRPPTVKLRRVQIAVKTVGMEIEEESQ